MTFNPNDYCACTESRDESFTGALVLPGGGLWVGLVSSGRCSDAYASALASPGDFFLGCGPLELHAPTPAHVVALRITGTAAESFESALCFYDGRSCPRGSELIGLLATETQSAPRSSALAYSLLCELSEASAPSKVLPPLVGEAIGLMREDYATLYGVEDISEALGVSKCHLIRAFSAAVGVSPGQYLTAVRLSAAKELLLTGEYTLETVAGLCGFSGANYFCRVFRRAESCTPTEWREREGPQRGPHIIPPIL